MLDVFRIESPYEKVTQIKGSGAADDAGIQRVVTVLEGKSLNKNICRESTY